MDYFEFLKDKMKLPKDSGIDIEDSFEIFKKGFSKRNSTGYGLYLAKKCLQKNGFDLQLFSSNPVSFLIKC